MDDFETAAQQLFSDAERQTAAERAFADSLTALLPVLEASGICFYPTDLIKPATEPPADISDDELLTRFSNNAHLIGLTTLLHMVRLPDQDPDIVSETKKRFMARALYTFNDNGEAWSDVAADHMPGEALDPSTDLAVIADVLAANIENEATWASLKTEFTEASMNILADFGLTDLDLSTVMALESVAILYATTKLAPSLQQSARETAQSDLLRRDKLSAAWIAVLDRAFPG